MARVGLVSSEGLKKNRKYVIVGIFAIAAILTPPDPISQIGLGIPILLLYELSIIAVSFIEKRKTS
jgi:sec-independent protein translocase protein TatC